MSNLDSEKITVTDGEMRVLNAIFANMRGKPDVDWDAAASAASLGNAKSIKERYRQVCVRLGWNRKAGGDAGSNPPTPKKKGGGAAGSSPCKVTKTTPRAAKKKPQYVEEDDNENEDMGVKEEVEDEKPAAAMVKRATPAHNMDEEF